MHVNTYGTFVVNACVADAINSQYPDDGPFAPRVKEERGVIINIASVVAKPVPARCLTYGTSKAAVLGLSGALADFLGPFGIRVNTVSPAVVQSALMGPDRIVSNLPLTREIATADTPSRILRRNWRPVPSFPIALLFLKRLRAQ